MTKCPKCGTETESKFCPNCGANLQESLSEEPAVIVEEKSEIPADEKTEKKKDKKKKSKTTICKHCGAEIATSAKACPKCGGKNKKPIYKRVWFWILIAILILMLRLVACGAGKPATVTLNDGTTEKVTAQELINVHDENEEKFDEKYDEADITFEGTIESIETGDWGTILIHFKEGWKLQIEGTIDNQKFAAGLEEGDKLRVTSQIRDCDWYEVRIGISDVTEMKKI